MTLINVRTAAQLAGKDRSTIIRAIEEARLSATRDERNRYRIDPSELERVYGTLRNPDIDDGAGNDLQQLDAADGNSAALLREIELLREMLDQERSAHARTRSDHEHERRSFEQERTFLRGMLERQTEHVKLLTDERQQKERHSPTLLSRLFRRAS